MAAQDTQEDGQQPARSSDRQGTMSVEHMAPTDLRRKAIERGEQVEEVPFAVMALRHPDLFQIG